VSSNERAPLSPLWVGRIDDLRKFLQALDGVGHAFQVDGGEFPHSALSRVSLGKRILAELNVGPRTELVVPPSLPAAFLRFVSAAGRIRESVSARVHPVQ
jgi:hypothetical protein